MSQSSPTTKTESIIFRFITITHLFWAAIIIVILGISLFAALIAEGWFVTIPSEPHSESTQAIQSSNESVPKTAGWKTMAQQIQQAENQTLQMVANALEKLPDLAPLPRPNVPTVIPPPAPVKTAPSSPIAWKLLSEQLAVTEQQQVMMLRSFLAKAEK